MDEKDLLTATLLEDASLTLEQVAGVCGVEADWIVARVREGLLRAAADQPEWRFSPRELRRVRTMRWLERDFDAVPELAALVADLIEELDELRAQLRVRGF